MIQFEKEIIAYLGLPSIPKKEWDGKMPFDKGVAIVDLGDEREAYAACAFTPDEGDKEPRITKVFGVEPFMGMKKIYVVPSYMNNVEDVKGMDLDEESKKNAERLLKEATEMENEGVEDKDALSMDKLPEWIFDNIHNQEEARAYIQSYNSRNKIKGRIPSTTEAIKLRLFAIYSEINNKKKTK